jgi:hypothetical protein
MSAFSQPSGGGRPSAPASNLLMRKPQRICATLPWHLLERLQKRADLEGRSLSNLVAFLLEQAG